MRYAPLGTTGIFVSRICLGTMTFGNPLGGDDCERLVAAALDRGIQFFDTANVYEGYDRFWGSPGGVSEQLLGQALKGRRHQAVICTKFGNPVGTGPLDAGLSPRHLHLQLEASLRRLQTDYLDVVLAHRWDGSVRMEEFLEVCGQWVRAGKVRCTGSSNWPVWRIAQACELAAAHAGPKPQVVSPKYNLLRRGVELEQTACAGHYGLSLVPYQPLEAGLLSGKYRTGAAAPAESRGAEKPSWAPKVDESTLPKLDALAQLAAETGATAAEYALAWVLSRHGVASAIMGCRNEAQLDAAARATALEIPAAHEERIDAAFPPPGPFGDEKILYWRSAGWALEPREG